MYEIVLSPRAVRDLSRLKTRIKPVADRIVRVIDSLKENPFLGKKLVGELNRFRSLRVADYRIIYCILKGILVIEIIKIAHRREVYKNIK